MGCLRHICRDGCAWLEVGTLEAVVCCLVVLMGDICSLSEAVATIDLCISRCIAEENVL